MRLLLRKSEEQYLMIIHCDHLREAGVMSHNNECCWHCHVLAGLCVEKLPNEHQALFCCARIDPFTPEEIATLLSRIPVWEEQERPLAVENKVPVIPERFRPAYRAIQRLERHERYQAAFIISSVARGEVGENDDLNALVIVVVDEAPPCKRMNHPVIEGVRLNLLFLSLDQLTEVMWREIEYKTRRPRRRRRLMIADCLIVFDKTRRLHAMQGRARQLHAGKISAYEQRQQTRPKQNNGVEQLVVSAKVCGCHVCQRDISFLL